LLDYARAYPLCHVEIVDEAFTSKTCGRCGKLHQQLGGQKVFACSRCPYRVDRDLNGARNIYLRYLTTTNGAPMRRARTQVCSEAYLRPSATEGMQCGTSL
jgi:transposase